MGCARNRRNGRSANLLLEILMIVVGINVALWFESWFQDLQDAEIEERYLADLRDDLLTDIKNLDIVIRSGEAKLQQVAKIIDLMPSFSDLSQDQLFRNFFVYTRQDTDTMVALYRLERSQSAELLELIGVELAD